MDEKQYHDLLEKIEISNRPRGNSYAIELLEAFDSFGIKSFYKYSKYHEVYTRDIIENNNFHLSPLSVLNDPAEHAFGHMKIVSDKKTKLMIDESLTFAEKQLYTYLNDQNYEEASNLLKDNTLICSLTTDGLSQAMWAHYADDYNGLCIEYDAKEILVYTAGKVAPILYSNVAPDVYVSDNLSFLKSMRKVSFSKSDKWSNEKEWRVSKVVLDANYSNLTDLEKKNIENDRDYTFKPKSVTVGYNMDELIKNEILNLCRRNDIPMFCVKKRVEGYKLVRVPYPCR